MYIIIFIVIFLREVVLFLFGRCENRFLEIYNLFRVIYLVGGILILNLDFF